MPDNADYYISPVSFNSVLVTVVSGDATLTDRIMLGKVEGGIAAQTTLPAGQLKATAFLNGVPLSQQPAFFWESSNPNAVAVDQSGNISRPIANNNLSSFDSNGAVSQGQIGGLANIRATAKRADGSLSGVFGEFAVVTQAAGPSAYPASFANRGRTPNPDLSPNLVNPNIGQYQ